MARALATPLAAALLLVLLPGFATATPPATNGTPPGLRGKTAAAPAAHRGNGTMLGTAGRGSCSAADEATMARIGAGNAEGTFPFLLSRCGKNSWSLFGGFSTREYESCIVTSARISPPCASCFSHSGVYGYRNCKFDCMFSWCSRACLRCVAPSTRAVKGCAGVPLPGTTPC